MPTELWNQGSDGRGPDPENIDPINYADKHEVVDRFREQVMSMLDSIRMQRQLIEQQWDRYYKVWAAKHEYRLYEGRSDLYFPIARKGIETQVAQLKSQVFPGNGSFWVRPNPVDVEMDPMGAQDRVQRVSHLLDFDIAQARINRWLDMFIRQGVIYGCSPVKVFWKVQQSTNYRRVMKSPEEMKKNAPGDLSTTKTAPKVITKYEGPTFKVVNLLDWYVHPITATDMDEVQIILEDIIVDYNHLKSMEDEGLYYKVDRVKDDDTLGKGGYSVGDQHKNIRLESVGVSVNMVKPQKPTQWKLTEVWCNFDLYGDGRLVACVATICNKEVLAIRQNPFSDQEPPYLVWKVIDVQDQFYGQGLVESVEHFQYSLNALLNQTMDAVVFQTNHIVAVNTSMLAQSPDTIRIAPRAIWKCLGNPSEVFSIIRPPDNSQAAFNTATLIAGTMQDSMNTSAMQQGKVPSKDITATETAAVTQGAQTGVSSYVDNIEYSVMTPLLHKFFNREVQFRPFNEVIEIAGAQGLQLMEEDTTFDYHFQFVTGKNVPPMVQAYQQQVQAQQTAGAPAAAGPTMGLGGPGMGGPGIGGAGGPGTPQLGGVSKI